MYANHRDDNEGDNPLFAVSQYVVDNPIADDLDYARNTN